MQAVTLEDKYVATGGRIYLTKDAFTRPEVWGWVIPRQAIPSVASSPMA